MSPWSHTGAAGRPGVRSEDVRAELPARVLEVLVAPGDAVRPGQLLVLVESMKMEIPVVPERAGRVDRVLVGPGDAVQDGDVLVVVDLRTGAA